MAFILYVSALMLLVSLGLWQVSRGQEKSQVLNTLRLNSSTFTKAAQLTMPSSQWEYRKVTLQGTWFAEKSFLLANRSYQNSVGYEVLTPFKTQGGQWILVNRGWVEKTWSSTPDDLLNNSSEDQLINGVLYRPDIGYTIGDSIADKSTWPVESIYLDLPAFSEVAEVQFLPLVLVLAEKDNGAFTLIWKPVSSGPERNYGYAVQWFGLALVLIVFGIIWVRRIKQPH